MKHLSIPFGRLEMPKKRLGATCVTVTVSALSITLE